MSLRGGGTAGGGRANQSAPQHVRHVPKFLQKFAHLLDSSHHHSEDGPEVCAAPGEAAPSDSARESFPDQSSFIEELEGATVVEGGLALSESEAERAAAEAKEKGNFAFAEGRHKDAIRCFSQAIAYCPKDAVLFSNRSAAYAAVRDYGAAADDAKKVVGLSPKWAKAYSRLGAALVGLNKLEEAQAIYRKGLELERGNPVLLQGLQQVEQKIRRLEGEEESTGKHVFRKRKSGGSQEEETAIVGDSKKAKEADKRKKPSSLLSFADDVGGTEDE